MKKLLISLAWVILTGAVSLAQQFNQALQLVPLTEQQMLKLSEVPEAKAPIHKGVTTLPWVVDNSALTYFRPLFTQSGLECGQASSIGLGLTYELNLLRNVPGNVPQNQYCTYFTYNFINGGSNAGVSFLESWEIVKRCGNPTVADYGGLSAGGPSRWMSGYNLYYNAMHNRITDVAVIYLNTVDGLNMMRSWIYNHMGQSTLGGVAHFYTQYGSVNIQLPAGTPQAGEYVITSWGASPNHAMTIVGYNDSIRYDYNGDGQYTNHLDINGDGTVNLKDWEIGGFKVANTYGNVGNWANQGFAWAMYKSFAENTSSGGIWNNATYIAYAKQDLAPKLTMKITLKHTSRNKIKVMAGVSTNLAATEPDMTLNLPIFDFQGGDLYMQGGTTDPDKTIEFGLDATPLLSVITSGQPAKFFLMVQEKDPSNQASGQITAFDLIDYTNGTVTIPSGISNLSLVENGVTTVTVNATVNVNKPSITTTALPDAKIYEPYSHQLNVTGGTTPYKWRMKVDYTESTASSSFPTINAQQLSVNSSYSGYATKDLPFSFPFYGKSFTRVYPHVDGYLMFEDHPVPWPYIIYERTFFKNNRCISPYMAKALILESGDNDGIWYQGNQDSASFRWKISVYGAGSTEINVAVTLFPDGNIKFYYGSSSYASWLGWIAGISNGDGVNYLLSSITDSLTQPTPNTRFTYATQPFPTEMSISDNGVFSGIPMKTYTNLPLKFYVEDNVFLFGTKTLNFNTKGVEINYQVEAGNDTIIEYGETVLLTPTLKNVSSNALHNVVMHLDINDPYTTLVDSVETIGVLNPGQVVTFPDAFTFTVSNGVPDNHMLSLISQVVATEDFFNRTIDVPARSANLIVSNVAFSDGNNNILMPGESGTLLVTLQNSGGSKATNLDLLLATIDPYMSIMQNSASIDTLNAGSNQVVNFTIQASASCPLTHIGFLTLDVTGDKEIDLQDSLYIVVGTIIEDFETGNYTKFPWQFSGNSNWTISMTQPYQGTFCSQSGALLDNQECSMYLDLEVLSASEISFYRKVSSENNYDFLYFYIDGQEMGKWSGEVPWGKVTYPVLAGTHSFRWKYKKDYSIASGSDKAWVDYISWPPLANMLLIAYAGPDDIACSGQGYPLAGQVINASSVFWSTNGDGTFTNINSPNANYFPGSNDLAGGQVTLTIHASQTAVPSVTDDVTLSIIQGPLANAGPDLVVCPGSSITIAQATAGYQTSLFWTTSGDGTFDNIALLNPTYSPGPNDLINGIVTLSLHVTGNTDCFPAVDALSLTFYTSVITNAGSDQTISYNTSTQLSGSASGGIGPFTASWEPANLLLDPTVFDPITVNLTANQTFTLTATNATTGCFSSDEVVITVTGGPLNVTATATPSSVCSGGSSQLNASGSGGSGNYTYQWTSNPPGFSSTLQNPLVTPEVTTIYTVLLNDGTASVSADVTVTVNSIPSTPVQPVGPNAVNVVLTTSTTYTTSATGNPSQYTWNFGPPEAGTIVPSGTSCQVVWNASFNGIASLSVSAANECGTSGVSDTLYITANFEVGTPEAYNEDQLIIYPNPGRGIFHASIEEAGNYVILLSDLQGKLIKSMITTVHKPGTILIDFSGVASGNYLISIQQDNERKTGRITIVR